MDRDRWFEFLIDVHGNDERLDTGRLGRWLIEVEGWSDDMANELVIEYEFALGLLFEYDKRQR